MIRRGRCRIWTGQGNIFSVGSFAVRPARRRNRQDHRILGIDECIYGKKDSAEQRILGNIVTSVGTQILRRKILLSWKCNERWAAGMRSHMLIIEKPHISHHALCTLTSLVGCSHTWIHPAGKFCRSSSNLRLNRRSNRQNRCKPGRDCKNIAN